jgi:ubiquinone/menaquinone biosynthesis C-methylase UbiE
MNGANEMETNASQQKGYKGLPMEGMVARRYDKLRRTESQREGWRKQAVELTAGLPDGARILEIAPGPGYFAIELARLGRFRVTGLDISRTFVDIARENARQAGMSVDFQLGNAADMNFPACAFDFIICQAAFKNFSQPGKALEEMHRVLRGGGTAVIQDLRKDASDAAIREEVAAMHLSWVGALVTRRILRGLRRRAYTKEQFEQMAAASPFGGCETSTSGIGVEVRLTERIAAA